MGPKWGSISPATFVLVVLILFVAAALLVGWLMEGGFPRSGPA